MPQISPINWVSIISFFTISMCVIIEFLPTFSTKAPNALVTKAHHKNLPW